MTDLVPPAETAGWDDLVLVGIVARAHGTRGQVIVNPHTDFVEERFAAGARLQMRRSNGRRDTVEIVTARVHQGRPVVAFAGIETMTDAEALAGAELRIHPDQQFALPAGRYYHHDLIGCIAVTTDGTEIGRVVGVESGGQSRLVIAGAGRRHEIPLADDICTVDLTARRVIVRPPEGLLDL